MARLDWLSWKYKILFMVSAGNKAENFDFEEGEYTKDSLLKNINKNLRNSKILSPAESINSITVGAQHKDRLLYLPHQKSRLKRGINIFFLYLKVLKVKLFHEI